MKNKRVITGIIFAVVMAVFVVLGIYVPGVTAGFFTIVAFACGMEYFRAIRKRYRNLSLGMTLGGVLTLLSPVISWLSYRTLRPGWNLLTKKDPQIDLFWKTDLVWLLFIGLGTFALVAGIYALIAVTYQALRHGPAALPTAFISLTSIPYIAFPFACLLSFLFAVPNGIRWLILALIAPWVTDVAAYYVGSFFGRRKILEKISPNKTFEGVVGGVVGNILVCLLYFIIFMRGSAPLKESAGTVLAFGAICGVVLGLVTQLGDWVASAVKRLAERKDFGHLLPGHGGVLDRFDSVLFSLPVTMVLCIAYSLF